MNAGTKTALIHARKEIAGALITLAILKGNLAFVAKHDRDCPPLDDLLLDLTGCIGTLRHDYDELSGDCPQHAVVKYDGRAGQFEKYRVIVDGKDFGTGFSTIDHASDCAKRINGTAAREAVNRP
jgi:hypothetical protein